MRKQVSAMDVMSLGDIPVTVFIPLCSPLLKLSIGQQSVKGLKKLLK